MENEKGSLIKESAQLVEAFLHRHFCTSMNQQTDISPKREMMNIDWVANKEFTMECGKKQIGEYIKTWKMQLCWLYSLDFLYSNEEEHHILFHYRARFSTPTQEKPIQGTASVYFAIGVSKVNEDDVPVDVLFIVESNRLVHTPAKTTFREKWLEDVIESKALLRRVVDF